MIRTKSSLPFCGFYLVFLLIICLLYNSVQAQADDKPFRLENVQIPAGKALVLQYQPGQPTTVIQNPVTLTTTAVQAVELVPEWLKSDLIDNLSRLDPVSQTTYARLILDCPTKKYLDEIAFCLGHISPLVLKDPAFKPEIITENVKHIYQTASVLKYVELIGQDDGTTTARYRIEKDGKSQWYMLPREYYYWFVVHPQFFTEIPQKVSGLFWREYFFNRADQGHLELNRRLQGIKDVWNSESCSMALMDLDKDKSLLSFALPVIGHWALTQMSILGYPEVRALQPNNILKVHGGTDTEHQAVLCAAARAALIPSAYVRNFSENQQWSAFYLSGKWWPFQTKTVGATLSIARPGNISGDKDYGGQKELSALSLVRGDGYIIERISGHSKTRSVRIMVMDPVGKPIDGACVRVKTPRYPGTTGYCGLLATFAYTDINGECRFTLGQDRDYELYASSPQLGKSSSIKILSTFPEGPHPYPLRLLKKKKELAFKPQREGPSQVMLSISCTVHSHVVYGSCLLQDFRKPEVRSVFAQRRPQGRLKVFACDSVNYKKYQKNQPFACYSYGTTSQDEQEILLGLPHKDKCFIIFHNGAHKAKVIANISIR